MSSPLRHLPNVISVARIVLIVPIALTLMRHELTAALELFALAAVSDAADGFLAKHFGWQSELGGILDPIADKLLLITVFVVLTVLNWVPLWLTVTVVTRDIIIVLGAAAYRALIGALPAHPSSVSKFNTLCQAVFVLAVLVRVAVGAEYWLTQEWMVQWLGALTFATTVVSGIDYMRVYGRRAAARGVGSP